MEKTLENDSDYKKVITINLPKLAIDALDSIVQVDSKNSRSGLLRNIVEDFVESEKNYLVRLRAFLNDHPAPKSKKKTRTSTRHYNENGFSNSDTIVTIAAEQKYLPFMRMFIGQDKEFPSRSELIRYVVKRYLEQWITEWNKPNVVFFQKDLPKEPENIDDCKTFNNHNAQNLVRIPIETKSENGKPIEAFKTFKVLKVLDSPAIEKKPQIKPKHKRKVPLGRHFENEPFNNIGSEPKFEADPEFRKKFTEGL